MRKSVVLALLLVLAVAGSSLAAEVSWSGEFYADAEYDGVGNPDEVPFFGGYGTDAGVILLVDLKDGEDDVWDASFELDGALGSTPDLGKYRVNVNPGPFQATAWGNYYRSYFDRRAANIGNKGDGLGFVVVSGANLNPDPKFRITSDLGGVALTGQIEPSGKVLGNAEMGFDDFKFGVTFDHVPNAVGTVKDGRTRYALYGGGEFGIVNFDAAFSSASYQEDHTLHGKTEVTALGVKGGFDVTEELNIAARFQSVDEHASINQNPYLLSGNFYDDSMYGVGATYTAGLLRFKFDYDTATAFQRTKDDTASLAKLGVVYRGSDENLDFDDLFGGKYHENEAFAFGAGYSSLSATIGGTASSASLLELKATGPVMPGQFWLRGVVSIYEGAYDGPYDGGSALGVDGHVKLSEQLVFKPHVSTTQYKAFFDEDPVTGAPLFGDYSDFTVKGSLEYALTDSVNLTAELGQTTWGGDFGPAVNRFNSVGISVDF